MNDRIPLGLCQCGCGEPTSIAPRTDRQHGEVKGQRRRFVRYHSLRVNHRPWAPLEERFWHSVAKTDGCWNWTASTNSGYGQIHDGSGRQELAHRVSWRLHFGEIADDLFVLHKCDNRLCVRPDHLFLGTQLENIQDMVNKGRQRNGPHAPGRPEAQHAN